MKGVGPTNAQLP